MESHQLPLALKKSQQSTPSLTGSRKQIDPSRKFSPSKFSIHAAINPNAQYFGRNAPYDDKMMSIMNIGQKLNNSVGGTLDYLES